MPTDGVILIAFFAGGDDVSRATADLVASGVVTGGVHVLPGPTSSVDHVGLVRATKAPEGATIGAIAGGAAGALACALLMGGALVIPTVGAVLAGPFAAALAGAGALGAVGLLAGLAIGRRFPEYEAAHLYGASPGVLVAVRCAAADAATVEELLVSAGGAALRRH